ncbi:MAG: S8 family serine peptidase [Flavobacteriales bacterium]|nr:S8 family serine peptidase [Flavobacteriales bacterium]
MGNYRLRIYSIVLLAFLLGGAIRQMDAQTAPDKYWIQFTDKANSPYSIDQPRQFLSDRALERRARMGIAVNSMDLPVNQTYINEVTALSPEIYVVNRSKWFNAITIHLPDSTLLESIANLPHVLQIKSVTTYAGSREVALNRSTDSTPYTSETAYGDSEAQVKIHGGHILHEMGFRGRGMQVAVLDAGFRNVDKLPAFAKLRNEDRILGTHDFVDGDDYVYHAHDHGMMVLSTMAGYVPDSLIGTANEASYYLLRTEDPDQENVIEEDNWIAAAEWADSVGVDLINTSLGYSTFEDSLASHTYADMDGNTARISIASDLAAARGMLLVTSAGNSGSNAWHYITAPADADSVLTVGAVDRSGNHAFFSSFGPTSDGRIKPDVMAIGLQSTIARPDSTFTPGNGTSFSSPIMCGLVTCLWQAFPQKSNMEIIDKVKRSAHLYSMPNDSMGYGIPDLWEAFQMLRPIASGGFIFEAEVFPNPFSQEVVIVVRQQEPNNLRIQLFDMLGREATPAWHFLAHDNVLIERLDCSELQAGSYVLRIWSDNEHFSFPVIKSE